MYISSPCPPLIVQSIQQSYRLNCAEQAQWFLKAYCQEILSLLWYSNISQSSLPEVLQFIICCRVSPSSTLAGFCIRVQYGPWKVERQFKHSFFNLLKNCQMEIYQEEKIHYTVTFFAFYKINMNRLTKAVAKGRLEMRIYNATDTFVHAYNFLITGCISDSTPHTLKLHMSISYVQTNHTVLILVAFLLSLFNSMHLS